MGQKTPSTATYITLLPPLLPPFNFLIIRVISPKVAVVAVKNTKHLVKEWHNNACSNVIRTGYPKVIRVGYPNANWTGHSVVKWTGHSVVKWIGHSVMKWIGHSVMKWMGHSVMANVGHKLWLRFGGKGENRNNRLICFNL